MTEKVLDPHHPRLPIPRNDADVAGGSEVAVSSSTIINVRQTLHQSVANRSGCKCAPTNAFKSYHVQVTTPSTPNQSIVQTAAHYSFFS
mmetsp:Transcript_11299/g.12904  ORF Transcript_11299/g.12904 Transcript_11299/m.12904 type:complete len:89 (+) Transcript_11299:51-317(+)